MIARYVKDKERRGIYIAPFYTMYNCISQSAQAWITQFHLQIEHACLSFVSVHQIARGVTSNFGPPAEEICGPPYLARSYAKFIGPPNVARE